MISENGAGGRLIAGRISNAEVSMTTARRPAAGGVWFICRRKKLIIDLRSQLNAYALSQRR